MLVRSVVQKMSAAGKMAEDKPTIASEYFSFYLEYVPGYFVQVGEGTNRKGLWRPTVTGILTLALTHAYGTERYAWYA
ncbi:hypothetical protein ABN789_005150 [Salmonella enterica]